MSYNYVFVVRIEGSYTSARKWEIVTTTGRAAVKKALKLWDDGDVRKIEVGRPAGHSDKPAGHVQEVEV